MFTSSSKVEGNKKKTTTRVIAPMVLVAFFVYAVSPSIVHGSKLPPFEKGGIEGGFKSTPNPSFTKGGEQQGDFSFTPPTTINNKTEEVDDYDQFDNGIPRVIPVDSSQNGSQFTVHGSQIYTGSNKCKPTADSATNGGWGWDGEKGCKLGAELPTSPNRLRGINSVSNSDNTLQGNGEELTTFINYLQAFLIASYATKPIDRNAVLSNYETYLYLKKQAKARKDKALQDNEKDFNLQKKNLLAKLQQFIKSIKDKFKTKLNNYQYTKTNLTNRLTTVRQTITNLANQLNQRQSLQQRLQQTLANFNYFQSKENQERNAYNQEKKEEKHNKKKYKKYKHKYKKKHKKKYKHRYKKYKRRYKEHKKRAQRHKNNYQSYERQKRAQANLYNQLRQQLASLNNVPNQLNSLRQEESVLQSSLNNLIPPVYNNSPEEDAKRKYQEDLNSLNTTHQNKQKEIEDNYQEDLTKAEVYQEYMNSPQPNSLTKAEQEEILKQLDKKEEQKQAKLGESNELFDGSKNNETKSNKKSGSNYNSPVNPFTQQLKNLQATLASKQQEEKSLNNDVNQAIHGNSLGGAMTMVAVTKSIPYTAYETITYWVDKWVTNYRKVKKKIKETLYRKVKKYKTIYKKYKQKVTYYVKTKVKQYYNVVKTKVKYVWKKVTSWIKKGWNWFKKKVKKRFKKVYKYTKRVSRWVTKKVKKVKTIWKTVKKKVKYYVKEKYYKYKTIFKTIKEKIKTKVKKTFQKAVTKYKQIVEYVKTKAKQGVDKVKNFIASLRQKINTVKNTINSLKSKIQEIGKKASAWYNEKKKGVTNWFDKREDENVVSFLLRKRKEKQEAKERKEAFKEWQEEERARKRRIKEEQKFTDYVALPDDAELDSLLSRKVYKSREFVELPAGVREATEEELNKLGLDKNSLEDKDSGFRMRVYVNKKTGKFTLSFAGTDPHDPKDVETDVRQSRGLETEQYKKVRELGWKIVEKIRNGELDRNMISATGQSLGGGLAGLFGAITECETHTFNAAGVHAETLRRAGVDKEKIQSHNFANITNHVAQGDMLTYLQEEATAQDLQEIKQTINDVTSIPVLGKVAEVVGRAKVEKQLSKESLEYIKGRLDHISDINQELPDALGTRVDYGSKQRVEELDKRIGTALDSDSKQERIVAMGVKLYDMVEQHGNY